MVPSTGLCIPDRAHLWEGTTDVQETWPLGRETDGWEQGEGRGCHCPPFCTTRPLTGSPCYLKESNNANPLTGQHFSCPRHPSGPSRLYCRRLLPAAPACFFPKSLVPALCLAHGVLGRGLGGRLQHLQSQGLCFSLASWQRPEPALPPGCTGKAVRQGAGHQPPSALLRSEQSPPPKAHHEGQCFVSWKDPGTGMAPARCPQRAADGPGNGLC